MSEPHVFYLGRHLLDHQIIGIHGNPVGKVDDLELQTQSEMTSPSVTALHTGQVAYGARFSGRFGAWITTTAQRLRSSVEREPRRLDASLIRSITHTVTLNVPAAEVPAAELETWLKEHFIGRIPGSGG
jgi:hypothetical protein